MSRLGSLSASISFGMTQTYTARHGRAQNRFSSTFHMPTLYLIIFNFGSFNFFCLSTAAVPQANFAYSLENCTSNLIAIAFLVSPTHTYIDCVGHIPFSLASIHSFTELPSQSYIRHSRMFVFTIRRTSSFHRSFVCCFFFVCCCYSLCSFISVSARFTVCFIDASSFPISHLTQFRINSSLSVLIARENTHTKRPKDSHQVKKLVNFSCELVLISFFKLEIRNIQI